MALIRFVARVSLAHGGASLKNPRTLVNHFKGNPARRYMTLAPAVSMSKELHVLVDLRRGGGGASGGASSGVSGGASGICVAVLHLILELIISEMTSANISFV